MAQAGKGGVHLDRVDLSKVWADEGSRAVEVMGGEPIRHNRNVRDELRLEFTVEEWRRIFNVDSSYMPADSRFSEYGPAAPIHIFFVRRINEGTK